MSLEENHKKAESDENHNMDVLKHCVLVTHVFFSFIVLGVKFCSCGSGIDGTFLELSCKPVNYQKDNFHYQEGNLGGACALAIGHEKSLWI